MAFIHDDKTGHAIDSERGISVYASKSNQFADAYPHFFFVYESAEFSFDFSGTYIHEKRKFIENGQSVERSTTVACRLSMPSSVKGKDGQKISLSKEQRETLKAHMGDGVYELSNPKYFSTGLRLYPDFRVYFTQDVTFQPSSSRPN